MSAKKAGKTRTASPPRKATRFPKTETALRGAPRTAADDDERSSVGAMAPEAAPAGTPPEPAAASAGGDGSGGRGG